MKKLDLNDLKNYHDNSVICLGFFDGFHLGHQKMILRVIAEAKKNHLKSVVITFTNHSLRQVKNSINLISLNEKLKNLKQLGVDAVLILKKEDHIFELTAKEFTNQIIKKLNTKIIVCGEDIRFGKNKKGDLNFLKENNLWQIVVVDKVLLNQENLSSSLIRNLLKNGEIKKANSVLLQPFSLYSKVIYGKQIGRSIDFKTANLKITSNCYLLKHGVYVGKVKILKKNYKAMINVGYNPTINDEKKLKIEIHILGFNQDIYGKFIKVEFLDYLRQEIKFTSLKQLKEQLQKDLIQVNNYNFS